MSHFVKIYGDILLSSVWETSMETRLLWISMLALADERGYVRGTDLSLSRVANIPHAGVVQALAELESPDNRSKSKEHDGRRILPVDGGWQIVNYLKYRELQTHGQVKDAERHRRNRALKRDMSRVSRGEVEVEVEVDTTPPSEESVTATAQPPNWPARLALLWRSHVGATSIPRVGKALKELVDEHGEEVVEKAMLRYVKETPKDRPKRLEWFAADFQRWLGDRFTGPMIVGGWMSDELERATRP